MKSNKSRGARLVEVGCPDGLDESAVDALIAEADRRAALAPVPTSALLDGSAAERRRRRIERRAMAMVVRSLPTLRSGARPDGEVA